MRRNRNEIAVAPGIVAHPVVSSGTPCLAGRWIGTKYIAGRFYAGESIESIAADYRITVSMAEQAIRYEYARRCKREPEMRAIYVERKPVLVTNGEARRMWNKENRCH